VGSLVILQGIAAPQQQPVLRKKKTVFIRWRDENASSSSSSSSSSAAGQVLLGGGKDSAPCLSSVRIRVNSDWPYETPSAGRQLQWSLLPSALA
jgi:hypothetical protein